MAYNPSANDPVQRCNSMNFIENLYWFLNQRGIGTFACGDLLEHFDANLC